MVFFVENANVKERMSEIGEVVHLIRNQSCHDARFESSQWKFQPAVRLTYKIAYSSWSQSKT